MSCSKWAYLPDICDKVNCPGDCDLCDVWQVDEDEEKEIEQEIIAARKGEE